MRALRGLPQAESLPDAPRIGIAHGTIVSRDAIGHDILGMVSVLSEGGFQITLIADHFGSDLPLEIETLSVPEALARRDFDVLIYHHSILWQNGETLLRGLGARRLLRYHNVTPSEFFAEYSEHYAELCTAGRAQTRRLVKLLGRADAFCADSAYNAAELQEAGARAVIISPPFTPVVARSAWRRGLPKPPYQALFVGRLVPNKGHFDLLNVVAAYVACFGPGLRLTVVGGADDQLAGYRAQLEAQIDQLGLRGVVRLRGPVDHATLETLFTEASVFLCMSEHEGFCVPVIEAQAMGLPVVSVDTTALGETIGPGQLVVPAPGSRADYLYIARLVHAACTDPLLRQAVIQAGHRNLLARFNPAEVADRFMAALAPLLEPRA
jgi:glycosyltransferase involved in cell wall biosynthesis